jgi:Mg2+/citrate symporter
LPDIAPKLIGRHLAPIKFIKNFILLLMAKKLSGITDTQLIPAIFGLFKIDIKDHVTVVEDDIFDILHKALCKMNANM